MEQDALFEFCNMTENDIRELVEEKNQFKRDRNRLAHISGKKIKNFLSEEIKKCLIVTDQSVQGVFKEVRQD